MSHMIEHNVPTLRSFLFFVVLLIVLFCFVLFCFFYLLWKKWLKHHEKGFRATFSSKKEKIGKKME